MIVLFVWSRPFNYNSLFVCDDHFAVSFCLQLIDQAVARVSHKLSHERASQWCVDWIINNPEGHLPSPNETKTKQNKQTSKQTNNKQTNKL